MSPASSGAERRLAPTHCAAERLLPPTHCAAACPRCLNLGSAAGLCRACRANEHHLSVVAPISYSVGGGWLHRLIVSYKRDADPSVSDALRTLASLLGRFVAGHERCVAAGAGIDRFQLVTTVPSAGPLRDLHHPLRRIVGVELASTRERYERLLVRSDSPAIPRVFDPARYRAARRLDGESVLLIDDMWTSGASAESAAAALLAAGAGSVGAIVIARHVNRGWSGNDELLLRLARSGRSQESCVLCAGGVAPAARPAAAQRGGGGPNQRRSLSVRTAS